MTVLDMFSSNYNFETFDSKNWVKILVESSTVLRNFLGCKRTASWCVSMNKKNKYIFSKEWNSHFRVLISFIFPIPSITLMTIMRMDCMLIRRKKEQLWNHDQTQFKEWSRSGSNDRAFSNNKQSFECTEFLLSCQ